MPLFTMFFMTALGRPEPVALTQAQQNFETLIWKKWGWNALFFGVLFSPHLLLTFLFLPARPELIAGVCVNIVVCLLVLLYTLLLKYSRPPAAGDMTIADTLRLVFLATTIPLFPVTIYLLHKQYQKARWQLQRYFR